MAISIFYLLIGGVLLVHLAAFLFLAVLRVTTGISVQRPVLWFTSIGARRISISLKDGLRLDIRGVGLEFHRPTYSQPTLCTLSIQELKVTLDPDRLATPRVGQQAEPQQSSNGHAGPQAKSDKKSSKSSRWRKMWDQLTSLKNWIKKLQSQIKWLKLIDTHATKTDIIFSGVGTLHVGSLFVSVDTRTNATDRSRLFVHSRPRKEEQTPAEWTISLTNILFETHAQDSVEVIDHCVINIHGFLQRDIAGLRDAAVFIKLGRLTIPFDDFASCASAFRARRSASITSPVSATAETPLDVKLDPFMADEKTVRAVAEARDFMASVLRGIREVSFAVGLFGLSKKIGFVQPAGKTTSLNMSLKEFGLDFFRLDSSIPAQAMYFSRKDVAHQALLSAISISVGVDTGEGHPERLFYIPMTTATIKTTLPAKLLQFATQDDLSDRNANVLFSNIVITSPSLDFAPRHVPLLLAMSQSQKSPAEVHSQGRRFFSRFLPKANISLSIQEPVIRVALPSIEPVDPNGFDFDLLISSTSSLSLDIQASHSAQNSTQYYLSSDFRINSHTLYYQTASKVRHNLMLNDLIELKAQVSATPDVQIVASANLKTLSLFLVRAEITKGIRQILRQTRSNVYVEKLNQRPKHSNSNMLRSIPDWLDNFSLEASDLSLEFAGLDRKLSKRSRGFALQLESWSTQYRSRKEDKPRPTHNKRRLGSRSVSQSDIPPMAKSPGRGTGLNRDTDGRRLAVHLRGVESFIIEAEGVWEDESFFSMPQTEITLSATDDGQGSALHVMALVKSLAFQYSLFRHYCFAVAIVMLNRTFRAYHYSPKDNPSLQPNKQQQASAPVGRKNSQPLSDFVIVDLKLQFAQVKARLPSDPDLMLHVHDLEAARHRYLNPYAKAQIVRLYTQAPMLKRAWNRVVSIKGPRIDVRQVRRKHTASEAKTERSFDFVSEAIRIGVPHQLVVHKVFENLVNTAKTVQQLHHRFRTGTEDYILAKEPEDAKQVPRVSIRTHMLLFELEDGAFEWKLGVIFRAGLVEQKQRLAREEAYRLKVRNLDKSGKPRFGRTGSNQDLNSHSQKQPEPSGNDADGGLHRHSSERARTQGFNTSIRYDKEGTCGFSDSCRTSRTEAWESLQKYNAQSWKKRVDSAMNTQHGQVAELRALLWGLNTMPTEAYHTETILQIPQRPSLLGVLMSDVNMTIDKPSFPLEQCPDFLHKVGKGLPKNTAFSLLIPLSVHLDMGECRVSLRDYPLPLLHIPAIKAGQSPRLPSWSLKTDFVIAEEFRDAESTRDSAIMVVPSDKMEGEKKGAFAVAVRRTVSPTKTYSDIRMEINTARDTRLTWGVSYQPAIQDMMQVIEGFTKPQLDPSDRVGFWDKIRLSFHSKINVNWKGDGDVHLMLKGGRDPYVVTGYGAGFVMVWRNDVTLNIHQEDDPCKFLTVDSGDYVLAIPDFKHYARQSPDLVASQAAGGSSLASQRDRAYLTKVIMKLSGKVRWHAGLVFERNTPNGKRSFDFIPHYDVTLKNPKYIKHSKDGSQYDAFRGFRSDYLHLSIGIAAPEDRDWKNPEHAPSNNYNSIHLTPRFFTHFFAWWGMFSGNMSLPVHQGPLFPGVEKSGKKFSRHIATIKYSLLFSPLYLAHIYKHKEAEEFASSEDEVAATGLKFRFNSFMMDVHQRRELFKSEVKGLSKTVKTSGMRIYQAMLDLLAADIRAVSATITGTSDEAIANASAPRLAEFQQTSKAVDLSAFTIPDNDFSWIDIDDFVEIDWTLPEDADPKTKILPLAYAPRFTYRRNTDHEGTISGEDDRHSPFGYEPTHRCYQIMGGDPHDVQIELVRARVDKIDGFIAEHRRNIGEQELLIVRETQDKEQLKARLDELHKHREILEAKKVFLNNLLDDLVQRKVSNDTMSPVDTRGFDPRQQLESPQSGETQTGQNISDLIKSSAQGDNVIDFNNRFVVHNAHIKWTNSLRNIMLRYLHQVSQRRGFIYYQSRKAVKFILDIIEEQKARHESTTPSATSMNRPSFESPKSEPDESEVQDRIQQLLDDGKRFVDADDSEAADARGTKNAATKADQHIAHGFVVQNTYHVRLVAPQIQFQSQKNRKSAILLTARGIRLKVLQIMDEERLSDEISGLVQRRFAAEMENTQFFHTQRQSFSVDFLHMYSELKYGASPSSSWPPWVPLEVVFDFDIGSFASYGFSRVVQKTSASLRYDKYNQLRLKYNDHVSDDGPVSQGKIGLLDSSMDHLWVDFPRLRAICDSNQYFAIYTIVVDLLMYSEPLEKTRAEKLEKIMLASDFSDLRGAPEMVVSLQDRIRQLEEIKMHFHINERYLDRKGWQDRINMEKDLAGCEDELFFMMKAITSSQRREDRGEGAQVSGLLRYDFSSSEMVWHLTQDHGRPLAEFQLRNTSFERVDNSDGSNVNLMEIDKIHGLNLLQNAIYPEILTAHKASLKDTDLKMLRVNWHMLEAVAGIPVIDTFEVNLHPLQVQLEYETGRKLFEYIFPGRGSGDTGQSPFMVKHQADDEDLGEEEEFAKSKQLSLQEAALNPALGHNAPGSATGAGSLEHRLTPTHVLPDNKSNPMKPSNSSTNLVKGGFASKLAEYDIRKFFKEKEVRPSLKSPVPTSKPSHESLKAPESRGRQSVSTTSLPDDARKTTPVSGKTTNNDKRPRFTLTSARRSSSTESNVKKGGPKNRGSKPDDLAKMLDRAGNYMTLAYVKVPSVVLCLSYKGKGNRNFEDIHNLVFTMPTVEYRNKTWSNLDLVDALKKDVIRALIHHTGTIIGNKFSHSRPGKNQPNRLSNLASSSAILSGSSSELAQLDGRVTSSLRGAYTERGSTDGSSFGPSPRFSDVTDSDILDEGRSYLGNSRSTRDAPPSSYASSLAPTPEISEETYEEDTDDGSDPKRTPQLGPTPAINVEDATEDWSSSQQRPQSTHHENGSASLISRSGISKTFSDLSHRAAGLRKLDTSNSNDANTTPSPSRRSSFMDANGVHGSPQRDPPEERDADVRSTGTGRSGGSGLTPKRTLKRILGRTT